MGKLKNYRSDSTRSFEVIQQCLAEHGVKRMINEYDNNGRISSITFSIMVNENELGVKLPARVDNVEKILYGDKKLTDAQREQSYRTAWANIRDWVTAQMALIDTNMVKMEEVFLPYVVDQQGVSLFEKLEQSHFLLSDEKR